MSAQDIQEQTQTAASTSTPTSTSDTLTEERAEQRDAFVGRIFASALGGFEVLSIYLGDRLGLYRALVEHGPATAKELASHTHTSERYIREWLEQQAAAGILVTDNATAPALDRRYQLPTAHAEVLVSETSLNYMTPLSSALYGLASQLPAVADAFQHGGGVPWADYGDIARAGQAALNRPVFDQLLGQIWLPSIPDIHKRLRTDPPARIADIACGYGWSSVAMARAYPTVRIDGFDSDEPSIIAAREIAERHGLADRLTFATRDIADPALTGRYDLVTVFEALHDMSRPVEALRNIRRLIADGGAVLIMDENVGESFTAPANEVDRFMYCVSVFLCLPTGMAEQPSAGTGTVMRPDTVRRYASEAGFRDVEILPIEHPFFRFYRLYA
ncbi:MAG TPA: class I SAM-dependent methyltransferase [Ktedonobacterales bacterium]